MFIRLLKDEEEKKMEFIDGIAIEIAEKDIETRIKEIHQPIPRYLKRINNNSKNGKILLLKSVKSDTTYTLSENEVFVKIPAFEPITKEQHNDANNVWPCHYYNHLTGKIDQKSLDEKLTILLDKAVEYYTQKTYVENGYCSNVCLIFDDETLISTGFDEDFILDHAILTCVRSVSASKRGYLCTGYSAILFQEPCLSCAMALVHGRIKNVFVLKKLKNGSFSKHKLNYNKFLNHRFNVYFYSSPFKNTDTFS